MREVEEVSSAHSEVLSFTVVCDSCLQVYKFENGSPKQRLKIILHRNNRNNNAGINDSSIKTRDVSLFGIKEEKKKEKEKEELCKTGKKKLLEQMLFEANPTPVIPSTRIPLERGQSAAKPIKRSTNMFQDW